MKWSSGLVIVLLAATVVLLFPISSEFRIQSAARLKAQKKRIEAVAAGDKAFEDGRFEVALAAYRRGLRYEPNSADALHGQLRSQAELILNRRLKINVEQAFGVIEQLESLDSDAAPKSTIDLALAQLYHVTNDHDRAAKTFAKVLAEHSDYRGHYAHGILLREMGDVTGARRAFESALRAQADFLECTLALAKAYRNEDKLQDAQEVLERQLESGAQSPLLRFELGDLLLELKAPEKAYRHLKEALAASRDASLSTRILGRLGIASFLTKRGFEAVGYFEQMPPAALTASMRSNLALAYQNLGNHRKAVALLRPLNQSTPLDPGILMQLMTSLMKSGQAHEARQLGTDFLMSAQRIKSLAASAESVRKIIAQIPVRPPNSTSSPTPHFVSGQHSPQ